MGLKASGGALQVLLGSAANFGPPLVCAQAVEIRSSVPTPAPSVLPWCSLGPGRLLGGSWVRKNRTRMD